MNCLSGVINLFHNWMSYLSRFVQIFPRSALGLSTCLTSVHTKVPRTLSPIEPSVWHRILFIWSWKLCESLYRPPVYLRALIYISGIKWVHTNECIFYLYTNSTARRNKKHLSQFCILSIVSRFIWNKIFVDWILSLSIWWNWLGTARSWRGDQSAKCCVLNKTGRRMMSSIVIAQECLRHKLTDVVISREIWGKCYIIGRDNTHVQNTRENSCFFLRRVVYIFISFVNIMKHLHCINMQTNKFFYLKYVALVSKIFMLHISTIWLSRYK
jgi:hypothetical protein